MDLKTFLVTVYCVPDDLLRDVLHGPRLRGELLRHGVALLAPFQTATYEKVPWPRWLVPKRRRVETVLAPLVERYHAKRTWARDL